MSQAGRYTPSNFPAGFVQTLTADTGGPVPPTAGNINVLGGSNINTAGNPATSTIVVNLDNTIHWPNTNSAGTTGVIYLNNISYFNNYGPGAIPSLFLGPAGNFTFSSILGGNIGIGDNSLIAITNAELNTACGVDTLTNLSTGENNCAFGNAALNFLTSGEFNQAFGTNALGVLLTGSNNTALGEAAGGNYTSSESNNIVIGNDGVASESNVIRIGTQGSGTFEQNACYIAGIAEVSVSNQQTVVINTATGQLGSIPSEDVNLAYTSVTTTPYVVLSTDEYLGVTTSSLAITIELPNAPATGRTYTIKDSTGNASTNNITVTTVGGAVLIDGATTFVMNTNYESINVIFNGTNYEVW